MKRRRLAGLFFFLIASFSFFNMCSKNGKEPDVMRGNDGRIYQTIKLGGQIWMAENLRETRYRNGDEIPEIFNGDEWALLQNGARCVYHNDEIHADLYGYLYNGHAVSDSRGIAPVGWRVPTDEDWKELEMTLGMSRDQADAAGSRLSCAGSRLTGCVDLWEPGELTEHAEFGTSGFNAFPGGYRYEFNGRFHYLGADAYFWSATDINANRALHRSLRYNVSGVNRYDRDKRFGFAIRLVRE